MRHHPLSATALVALCSSWAAPQQAILPQLELDPARAAALEAYEASGEAQRRVAPDAHPKHLRGPGVPYGLGFCDDVLYGIGPGYTVRFEAGGFVLHERGERDGPLHSLSFSLWDIRRGDELIYSRSSGAGRPEQDGFVATVPLTPEIDANFEVGAAGVEQSFLFYEVPGSSGDLVVRGRLQTDLECLGTQAGSEGLLFRSPHGGDQPYRLRYGGVTGIDASGVHVPGTLEVRDGMLELRLPALFVDNAEAPLLLDPVIGPMDQDLPTFPYYSPETPAVAFDETNQRYLAVWVERGASGGRDIYGQFRSPSGSPVGGLLPIVFGDWSPGHPELANINATDKFLIVYRANDLYARSISAGSGAVSSRTLVETQAGYIDHDVGGEVLPPYDKALVASSSNLYEVRLRLVRCPSSGPPVVASYSKVLVQSPDEIYSRVTVSNSGGSPGRWMVGWREQVGSQYDIRGALVDYTFSSGFPTTLINNSYWDDYPSVTGDGNYFAAAATDFAGVHARSFYIAGNGTDLTPLGPQVIVSSGDFEHGGIELERVGPYYAVAWQSRTYPSGSTISRIVGRKLWVYSCNPAEPVYTMSEVTGGESHDRLRLFSESSASPSGSPEREAMLIDSTRGIASQPYEIYLTVIGT